MSLQQGLPELENDEQAIGEAVKERVTRSAEIGQGNGLAGTLRIAAGSKGSFSLVSGRGRISVFIDKETGVPEQRMATRPLPQFYHGTIVYARIGVSTAFALSESLTFGGQPHYPSDVIEVKYLDHAGDIVLKLSEETTGFGSRQAGREIRTKCRTLLDAEPDRRLVLDWRGVPMISSSFADEALGRLFVEMGPLAFGARVSNRDMEQLVRQLVDRAILQRVAQEG